MIRHDTVAGMSVSPTHYRVWLLPNGELEGQLFVTESIPREGASELADLAALGIVDEILREEKEENFGDLMMLSSFLQGIQELPKPVSVDREEGHHVLPTQPAVLQMASWESDVLHCER